MSMNLPAVDGWPPQPGAGASRSPRRSMRTTLEMVKRERQEGAFGSVCVSFTPVHGGSPATAGRLSALVMNACGRW